MKLRDEMPELFDAEYWLNKQVTKSELIGEKPTLIHFWSISSNLSKDVMTQLNDLREKYEEQLNIVAVHIPQSDDDLNLEEIENVAAELNITQPIYIDNAMRLNKEFDNQYVPAYYVFNKTGTLQHFQAGGNGIKMLEKRIIKVLNEQ